MAVKISKQKTASAASEKKANTSSATKFEKGKKVSGEKKEKSAKRAERSHRFTERIEFGASLCLSQKLTDEQIIEKVTEKFPGYAVVFNQKEVGRCRWMLKHDMLPNVHADGRCWDRCYLIDGKLVTKAEKPKSARAKRKAKFNAESDPLNIIAGVNVHDADKAGKKPIKNAKKTPAAAAAAESDAL